MMQPNAVEATVMTSPRPPSDLRVTFLIARRGAIEALRDRMTFFMSLFFSLVLPLVLVVAFVVPIRDDPDSLRRVLAIYVLVIGLMPASSAIGIASGQFAGEKEQGNLAPLLATPASNVAIFGGKVLSSVAPCVIFSFVAETMYLIYVAIFLGSDGLSHLPVGMVLSMVLLVPMIALFASIVASLISSRVRTFNTAQQISGLVMIPLWGVLIGLSFALKGWVALMAMVVILAFVDLALTVTSAKTWRREEVLSKQ
ncbi:MAG TPA: ABC transporter permease [Nitrolancea sp.]|jgi:ABC-type Na+ efflux pump permease subunit|nr:ABC transporter permease [Nitrolancea sp.]